MIIDSIFGGSATTTRTAPTETRSIENPSTSLNNSDEWFFDWATGGTASSGIAVNPKTAMTYSPVWRAVNLISSSVAKLPFVIYERDGQGKSPAKKHPSYRLLKFKSALEITSYQLKYTLTAHALLHGNGYGGIVRRADGQPVEIIPLNPQNTYPVRANGIVWYITTDSKGGTTKIPYTDVLHIKTLTSNGIDGLSVISYAKESLGLGLAAQKFGCVYFKNGSKPSIVIEHPQKLTPEAVKKLRDSWGTLHKGIDNSNRPAILEEGMKVSTFGISNDDSQFIQTREFEIRQVANWFGIPAHKLGDTSRTSYSSLEQENQSFLDDCLDPWLVAWESECWDKLLTEKEKLNDTHVIEFTRNALMSVNAASRGAFYNLGIMGGWLCRDEVRAKENMNPIPDNLGKTFLYPLNMAPATTTTPKDESKGVRGDSEGNMGVEDGLITAYRALFADVVARMCKRLSLHAIKHSKNDMKTWLDSFENDHRGTVIEAYRPILDVVNFSCGLNINVESVANQFFSDAKRSFEPLIDTPERATEITDSYILRYPTQLSTDIVIIDREDK